jgi:hypothetical protein
VPISQAEAKMIAARLVLQAIADQSGTDLFNESERENWPAVQAEIRKIEAGLRRAATGGDKILLRQLEKETGRQVRPTAKQARALGLPKS